MSAGNPNRFAAPLGAVLIVLIALLAAAPAGAKPAGAAAKLSVVSASATPHVLEAGQRLTVRGVVRNRGRAAAKPRVTIRLRSATGSTRVLGARTLGRLASRRRRKFSFGATVPTGSEPGAYRAQVCVRSRGPRKGRSICRGAKQEVRIVVPDGPTQPGKVYPAGARTAGDRLFPEVGNGGYDVGHYDIALNYDAASNSFLAGTQTAITATATQDLGEFSLDFEGLNVGAVTVNGAPATWQRVQPAACSPRDTETSCLPSKLVVTPATGIDSATTFTTRVSYTGVPQHHVDPDGSIEGWIRACFPTSLVCDGAFVVNEPIGSMTWFPGNNTMTDKATFDTAITTGSSKTALGSGELTTSNPPSLDPGGTTRTWTWRQAHEIPTYLTSGTVGDFDFTEGTVSTGGGNSRTIPVYTALDSAILVPPKATVEAVLDDTQDILSYYSARYGDYPFDSAGAVVDQTTGVGYTLENATKIHFASPSSVDTETLAHEYGHQWFGDNATAATWQDLWFNEGYATWSQWNYSFASDNSNPSPAQLFQDGYDDAGMDWTVPPATLNDDSRELFNSDATYERGAMTLEGYAQIVGEPKALELAATLQAQYAYSNITTQQFIDAALAKSGFAGAELDLLTDYFQQWLYGTTKPTITPSDF